MKKLLLAVVVLALVFAISAPSNAQSKMALGVGADVLLPMGTFGDVTGVGFGGSVRFQYDVTPEIAVGATAGYYTWGGKDFTSGGVTIKGGGFKGVPVRAFGKFYFMPAGKLRVYGIAELGMFFGSSTVPAQAAVTFGGFTIIPAIPEKTVSSTDFNYAPGVGVEIPAGKMTWDASIRYDGIATSGSSSGSLGARVGVNFPL